MTTTNQEAPMSDTHVEVQARLSVAMLRDLERARPERRAAEEDAVALMVGRQVIAACNRRLETKSR